MILQAKAVKTGTALAPPLIFSALPIDFVWVTFILLGMILGWLARAGRMISQEHSWYDIKRDMLVSLLIGGGNGLLATIIIFWLGLNYLQGVGVAFICAFFGVKTLEAVGKWILRKFLEEINEKGSS